MKTRTRDRPLQKLREGMEIKKTRVYVEGHGCSASLADTEIISGLVAEHDFHLVDNPEDADVSVLVTCSVKTVTEQRMLSRIRELTTLEGRGLVVAGCLAKSEPEKILEINPHLSLIGPGNLDKVVPAIDQTLSGGQLIDTEPSKLVKLGMPRTRKNEVIGVIEIGSGCLSSCTFCQVKLVKGTVFSYPESSVISEVESLVKQGCKELWLTSTDNSAYGGDDRTSLAKLMKRVCDVEGDFMVRVGMMNPLLTRRMLSELTDAFLHEKVFKFLHLPVQSGSNRILKEMRRGYTLDAYYETLEAFRSKMSNLTVSTDMICGFPSESESEFEESLELIRQSKPDIVNISRFGAREGTLAMDMREQVSSQASKSRSSRMAKLVKEISLSNNQHWVGWEGEVLLDEVGKSALVGRNVSYKPCVVIDKNLVEKKEEFLGKRIKVRAFNATASTLRVNAINIERNKENEANHF